MARLLCGYCGDIVGVYEPAWLLLNNGAEYQGSTPAFGEIAQQPGAIVLHEQCYDAFQQTQSESRAET